jgi:hypothetical protein
LHHQELVFKEEVLGKDGPSAATLTDPDRPDKQVQEQGDELFHNPEEWQP